MVIAWLITLFCLKFELHFVNLYAVYLYDVFYCLLLSVF